MTAPNVTLDYQIKWAEELVNDSRMPHRFRYMHKSILATLQSIKDAGDDVVEPEVIASIRRDAQSDTLLAVINYIDTLLSAYKRARGKHAIEKQNAIHYKAMFEQAESERDEFRRDAEDKDEVLQRIKQWCEAYPIDIFPEPDFKKAHEVLTANGMTLDAISASSMRHVVTQISKMIAAIDSARNK